MGIPMRRNLSASFGLQQFMDSQLFNVNFLQNIQVQRQGAPVYVDDKKINSPGVAIRAWGKMDVQRSVMKRKKR